MISVCVSGCASPASLAAMICPRPDLPLASPVMGYEQADENKSCNTCGPALCFGLHLMMNVFCFG